MSQALGGLRCALFPLGLPMFCLSLRNGRKSLDLRGSIFCELQGELILVCEEHSAVFLEDGDRPCLAKGGIKGHG